MKSHRHVSTTKFTHKDSLTGLVRTWQQEDESKIKTRQEAIDMVQRTIDFWLPKLRDKLISEKHLSRENAELTAVVTFRRSLREMSGASGQLPAKFKFTVEDLRIEF